MPRIVHFEIISNDTNKIRDFYKNVFNWEFISWGGTDEYILVKTGEDEKPGINGGLFKSDLPQKIINTIDVPNIEEFVEKIKSFGGEQVTEKSTIQGVGYFSYCKDCEGNMFGIMQSDENAGK
jgi:uncharacterized protein